MILSKSRGIVNYSDPRILQIFLLSSFLIYVSIFLDALQSPVVYLAAIFSCLMSQVFWIWVKKIPINSLLSALISALGLCLLLKVDEPLKMFAIGVLTISSKFLIRYKGKHIFNPTNLGIIIALVASTGWIAPGQWGSGGLIVILIGLGAASILFGIGRWDVSLSFLGIYLLLEYARTIWYLGWETDVFLHSISSATVYIFAFFMITDPRTAPNTRVARIIWGAFIAGLSFLLTHFFYSYQAPIIALFIFSALTPIFNSIWVQADFKWDNILSTKQIQKL
jgi:Na+-transporting NADH:ubiquinone oxidoreductase subunit NqrB